MIQKITCLVCDDEPVARRILKNFIDNTPRLELAGECENGLEAIAFLQDTEPDLLFLDIDMPILDGLSFLKTLKKRPKTILTTAHSEHGLTAYDLDVIDYLLKPIPYERFLRAIEKAEVGLQPVENLSKPESPEYLIIRFGSQIHRVRFTDILFIEAQANAVKIVTESQIFRTYQTLSGLEQQLPQGDFVRTHRSFLVNRQRVSTIEGLSIVFAAHGRVPISEPLREEVLEKLGLV